MEVGLDVAIRVEEVFDESFFQSVLDNVFDRLSPIPAVFGSALKPAAMNNLLSELNVSAVFQVLFSAGVKLDVSFVDFSKILLQMLHQE